MIEKRHANIPLFIPHMGCPHNCIFCNQKTISGTEFFDMEKAEKQVVSAIQTLNGRKAELAFFGGSFTAIDRTQMISLLEMGRKYMKSGALSGIRLSTRPDAVGEDILDILEEYGVTSIELGVQSMAQDVLDISGRGHTVKDTEDAFFRITKRKKFSLAGQMMLGLPSSTEEKEVFTAKRIIEMGADSSRIYPTVVLRNTPLAWLYEKQKYTPLTLEDGVKRGAHIYKMFEDDGVTVLRMGLCSEEGFDRQAIAGCYHPAYGELVENRLYYEELKKKLTLCHPQENKKYTVYIAKGAISKAIGQKKSNKEKLEKQFGCTLFFKEDASLYKRDIVIRQDKEK